MDFNSAYSMTIAGQSIVTASVLDVIDPATEEVFATAPDCSREQLDQAVAAARAAQPGWAAVPIAQRKQHVIALAKILTGNVDPLSRLLSREQGKPIDDAAKEIGGAAYWLMSAAQLDLPLDMLEDTPARRQVTAHVPLGVVGAIVAWNFPVLLLGMKVTPALVAGNTIVLKPSPYTPLTTLEIGRLFRDALPPGVLNIICGGNELGQWMTEHPGIDKIAFTGSTNTGKNILRSAAGTMKRVTLEAGGNDAAIVFADADVKHVAEAVYWGAFRNTGQICVAAKRVYIHEDIYDSFLEAITAVGKTMLCGPGTDPNVKIGPLQNKMQYERVKELIADARQHGHSLREITPAPSGPGYFLPVTIVDNPPDDARSVTEEAFGPLLPLLKFRTDDEVVRRANDTTFGLAASIWTSDVAHAEAIAPRLECGTISINTIQDQLPTTPIAGHKQSGLGTENGYFGLLEYTNAQTVIVRNFPG